MPNSYLSQLPKSRSSEEFELICKDILQQKYSTEFHLYGRNGQAQNGIDLFGLLPKTDDLYVVAQCKNYFGESNPSVLIKKMEGDLKSAKQQENIHILIFYLMTAHNQDFLIQNFVIESRMHYPFKIEVLFWEEIQQIILFNQSLFEKFYPYFFKQENLIALFNLAFFGIQFSDLIFLMLGDRGETNRYCELLRSGSDWIKDECSQQRFSEYLDMIYKFVNGDLPLDILLSHNNSNEYSWCCEIEKIVSFAGDSLSQRQRTLFQIGLYLGNLSKVLGKNEDFSVEKEDLDSFMELCRQWGITEEQGEEIKGLFERMLLPAPQPDSVEEFKNYSTKINTPYDIYEKIHSLLMHSA